MANSGVQAVAALKEAPSLHTLTLHLGSNSIGDGGAQALAALKEAPSLHTLGLYQYNVVGDHPLASPNKRRQ